jgi:aspartate oxidase
MSIGHDCWSIHYYKSSSDRRTTANDAIAREATVILTRLNLVIWNDVGVVRTPGGLERAVSEFTAMSNTGEGGREAVALRDLSRAGLAVADATLHNRSREGVTVILFIPQFTNVDIIRPE